MESYIFLYEMQALRCGGYHSSKWSPPSDDWSGICFVLDLGLLKTRETKVGRSLHTYGWSIRQEMPYVNGVLRNLVGVGSLHDSSIMLGLFAIKSPLLGRLCLSPDSASLGWNIVSDDDAIGEPANPLLPIR